MRSKHVNPQTPIVPRRKRLRYPINARTLRAFVHGRGGRRNCVGNENMFRVFLRGSRPLLQRRAGYSSFQTGPSLSEGTAP